MSTTRTNMTEREVAVPMPSVRAKKIKAKFDDLDDYLDAIKTSYYNAAGAISPSDGMAIIDAVSTNMAMTLADGTVVGETIAFKLRSKLHSTDSVLITPAHMTSGSVIELDNLDDVEKVIWRGSAWSHLSAETPDDAAGGSFTSVGHGQVTGAGPFYLAASVTLPAGAVAHTEYWLIVTTPDTFEIATSRANALAGLPVNITSSGAGTITLTKLIQITAVDDTTEKLSAPAHGVPQETKVEVETQPGGVMPAPLVAYTDYFVTDGPGVNDFQLSTTLLLAQAPTPINLTTNGTLPLRLLYLAFKTISAVNHT